MRYTEITEGRRFSFEIMGQSVPTIENPSRAEFVALLARSQYHVLRGMLGGGGLLIWDAALATHDHREFGDGERIVLTTDMVLYYPDADESEEDFEEVIQAQEDALEANRFLRIVFAGNVRPFSYYEFPNLHIG